MWCLAARLRAALLVAVALTLWSRPAATTSYALAPAYQIVCLDRATGKKLWSVAPGILPRPRLKIAAGKLLVEGELPGRAPLDPQSLRIPRGRPVRYLLDPATGRVLPWSPKILRAPVQVRQLEQPQPLTDSEGRTFEYEPGGTHSLKPPPQLTGLPHRVVLTVRDKQAAPLPTDGEARDGQIVLDLSEPLSRKQAAYVKFTSWYEAAILTVDGQVAATASW